MKIGNITVGVKIKISLWSAIKMRIAGFSKDSSTVSIQELIDKDRA